MTEAVNRDLNNLNLIIANDVDWKYYLESSYQNRCSVAVAMIHEPTLINSI